MLIDQQLNIKDHQTRMVEICIKPEENVSLPGVIAAVWESWTDCIEYKRYSTYFNRIMTPIEHLDRFILCSLAYKVSMTWQGQFLSAAHQIREVRWSTMTIFRCRGLRTSWWLKLMSWWFLHITSWSQKTPMSEITSEQRAIKIYIIIKNIWCHEKHTIDIRFDSRCYILATY